MLMDVRFSLRDLVLKQRVSEWSHLSFCLLASPVATYSVYQRRFYFLIGCYSVNCKARFVVSRFRLCAGHAIFDIFFDIVIKVDGVAGDYYYY